MKFLVVLCLLLISGTAWTEPQAPATVGKQYLKSLHPQACLELDAAKVPSRVAQDKLVCELADPRLTEIFPLLEHGSPPAILGKKIEKELDRIYTLLATEGAAAYSTKEPSGNSHGMYQTTEGTFYGMCRYYPTAGLPKKFSECAQNHVCSAKVAILLNDANSALLAHRMPMRWQDRMRIGTLAHARYLAAAYTAGMLPYRLVMRSRGAQNWTKKLPRAQWRRYVRMLERLWHTADDEAADEST